jgi:hypothetical protein
MNVRIDMTSFGRRVPPMKSQCQTNRDEVAAVNRDRDPGLGYSLSSASMRFLLSCIL